MILLGDLSLGVVAWISVILIQAFVHLRVFGGQAAGSEEQCKIDESAMMAILPETELGDDQQQDASESDNFEDDELSCPSQVEINAMKKCDGEPLSEDGVTNKPIVRRGSLGGTSRGSRRSHASETNPASNSNSNNLINSNSHVHEVYDDEDGEDDGSSSTLTTDEGVPLLATDSLSVSDRSSRQSLNNSEEGEDEAWRLELMQTYYSANPRTCSLMVNNFDVTHARVGYDDDDNEDHSGGDEDEEDKEGLSEDAIRSGAPDLKWSRYQATRKVAPSGKLSKCMPMKSHRKLVSFNLGGNGVATTALVASQ